MNFDEETAFYRKLSDSEELYNTMNKMIEQISIAYGVPSTYIKAPYDYEVDVEFTETEQTQISLF